MRSLEPGEDWGFCFVDEMMFEPAPARIDDGRAMSPGEAEVWPALPLDSWRDTYDTLHMWTQIVGKTRLALAPPQNHWWQVALYLTPRGFTTSAMPLGHRTFAVDFDFIDHHPRGPHQRRRDADPGSRAAVGSGFLSPRISACCIRLQLEVTIHPVPVEVRDGHSVRRGPGARSYDSDAANRCWRILVQADRVLKRFRGEFIGKSSPVHFFWGGFDLAATRFSGRPAPLHPRRCSELPGLGDAAGYSHECSSCGFWPGGAVIAEPAFYAYAYPTPARFGECRVQPEAAFYSQELGEFILPYEAVRTAAEPDQTLLAFFRSTYEAVADLAGWDRAALERLPKP